MQDGNWDKFALCVKKEATSAGSSSSSSAVGAYKAAVHEGADAYHDAIDEAADQLKEAGVDRPYVDKAAKDARNELGNFGDDD